MARRRARVPRPVAAAIIIAVLGLLWVGTAATRQAQDQPVEATVVPTRPDAELRASRSAPVEPVAGAAATFATGTFATVGGLSLTLPHPAPVAVAFREARLPEALALAPVGRLSANDNRARFSPPADVEGPAYRVLSSRGRGRPATSSVDVVVPAGAAVTAPVTGRVVEVREYALPGGARDWRVVVEAGDQPQLSVVMVHLMQPSVAAGDAVEAGVTPVGSARQLDAPTAVDEVLDGPAPQVHLEVKPSSRVEPVDPNARALEPEQADAGR